MWSLDRASFLTCPLGCFKFHLFLPFRPLQELSIQLYAKIEEDTKGTEEEGVGKGSYQVACLHKVCLRHLVSVARYLPLCLREQSGCENERRLGRERLELFFVPGLAPNPRTVGDESNVKSVIKYCLCRIFRKSWTGLVVIHSGTKFWAEKTHLKKKNG